MSKGKILIVDDDREIITLLQVLFENSGYTVITASNGRSAIAKTKEEHPDLMILDVMMPGMDGYHVLNAIKSHPSTKDIIIAILTAKSVEKELGKSFDEKADWFFQKPFDSEELLRRIEMLLQNRKK